MGVPAARVRAALADTGRGNPLLGMAVSESDAGAGLDAPTVAGLVDAVGDWLHAEERRVAASLVVLGYSARLVGPVVAVLLRHGILLEVAHVRHSYTSATGFRLTLAAPREPGARETGAHETGAHETGARETVTPETVAPDGVPLGWEGPRAELLRRWRTDVVEGHLGELIRLVRAAVPVAEGLLWGNVASGVVGALRAVRAEPADAASMLTGPLLEAGTLTPTLGYTRRSCCLFYRLPGGGTCGDCCLRKSTLEVA
jgi:hypothetical protein